MQNFAKQHYTRRNARLLSYSLPLVLALGVMDRGQELLNLLEHPLVVDQRCLVVSQESVLPPHLGVLADFIDTHDEAGAESIQSLNCCQRCQALDQSLPENSTRSNCFVTPFVGTFPTCKILTFLSLKRKYTLILIFFKAEK